MESLADQLRAYIIRPVLVEMGMHSQGAENLLIGTAAGFERAIPGMLLRHKSSCVAGSIWKNDSAGPRPYW